jgi:iron complex outermembrane receptor protein
MNSEIQVTTLREVIMSRTWKSLLLASGTWAALAAAPALAQDADADEAGSGEIVVTAQKRAQSVQDIPFTVNAVAGESLQNAGVTDVFSLQTQVPGLDIRTTNPPSAGGAFSIRGLGTGVFNLGFEPSVGTVIDNVYRSRSGLVAGSDFLDLERVEVLKGPQGTLFGKNTSAGLIHFVTAKPDLGKTAFTLRGEYGNHKRVNLQGMVNLPLSDTAALRVAAGFVDDDGYIRDAVTGAGYGEKHRFNIRGQILIEPSDSFSVRLIADYAKADELSITAVPFKVDAADTPANQALATAAGSRFFADRSDDKRRAAINTVPLLNAEDWGLSAEINFDIGGATLSSVTSYRKFTDTFQGDNDFVGTDILNTNQGESIKTFTQELRLSTKVGENLDLMVGGFYSNEKIRRLNQFVWGRQIAGNGPGFFFPWAPGVAFTDNMGQDGSSYGFFAHGIAKLDRLTVTAGLRYSGDNKDGFGRFTYPQPFPLPMVYDYGAGTPVAAKVDDSGISGTFSLAYEVSDASNIYGTYSRGYKGGGISLIRDAGGILVGPQFGPAPPPGCGAGPFPGTFSCAPSDPTFDKETVDHFEVGLKTTFMGSQGRFNLALFHTKAQNLQTQALLPSGSFSVINIGSATTKGVDIDAGVSPVEGLDLTAGVVYAETKDNNGFDLDHAPRWSGGFGATYEFPISSSGVKGFVHGDLAFKSSYFTTNDRSEKQDGYSLANARIGIRGEDDRWEASLWCRNCFDTKYRTIDFRIPLDGARFNFDGASVLSYIGESRFYGVTLQYKY